MSIVKTRLKSAANFFRSSTEFRRWLDDNHDSATEIWVGLYKKNSAEKGITYSETLDQALCYGWIDGALKSVDENVWMKRFTPRKPGSIWSLVNIKRVEELKKRSLMMPAGLRAFDARVKEKSGIYSYEQKEKDLAEDYKKKLTANRKAWKFFQSQAPSYRRTATHWVMRAKQEETRQKRLNELIEESGKGLRLKQFAYSSWKREKSNTE
jgi:uncharacterized protein YdeI (YjbR/CyaY-like superfamily)